MDILEIKKWLLSTDCFIDNVELTTYLNFCFKNNKQLNCPIYCEWHHILPITYYKYLEGLTTKEARNRAVNDEQVYLTYADHCKAHFLLAKCTKAKLRQTTTYAAVSMFHKFKLMDTTNYAELQRLADEQQLKAEGIWTSAEINWLVVNRPTTTVAKCAKYLNKSSSAVSHKCLRLNILVKEPCWTKAEDDWLINNRSRYSAKYCASHLNRTIAAIESRCSQLNITKYKKLAQKDLEAIKQEYYNDSSATYKSLSEKFGCSIRTIKSIFEGTDNRTTWTTDNIIWLKQNYYAVPMSEMMLYLKKSEQAIRCKAHLLGLTHK